jgi:hypothetical protein
MSFVFQPFPVPEPLAEFQVTKAVVGAPVSAEGMGDDTIVIFDVKVTNAGAGYLTHVEVQIATADSIDAVRSKTVTAVKARVLEEFGFEMTSDDVILPDFHIGTA